MGQTGVGGHNTNPDWKQTFEAHPAEMLFDLEKDPDELHDLSTSPEYVETLFKMRQALSEHIRTTGDLGFFLPDSRTGHILYEKSAQGEISFGRTLYTCGNCGNGNCNFPSLCWRKHFPVPCLR